MNRSKKFHKNKCSSLVRATIQFGNTTITLIGKHAFEWSIVQEGFGKLIITTFHNREKALEEFEKYKGIK